MRKLTAILLSVLVCLSAALPVWAEEELPKAVFELGALGIMQADENGEYRLEEGATRAEFAAIVVRMLNLEEVAKQMTGQTVFSDVAADSWYCGAVALLSQLGILRGSEDGTFRPEDAVSFQEAVKVVVSCLGYGGLAAQNGGYPNGYLAYAQRLGLLANVNAAGNTFLRRDLAQMIYNALDVGMMKVSYQVGGQGYSVDEGETLRGLFDKKTRHKGIVMANYESYLITPVSNLKKDEVVIDDVIYKIGNTDAASLLGQQVEYFVEDDEDKNEQTLLSIRPTANNDVAVVEDEDIVRFSHQQLAYQLEEDSRPTTLTLSVNAAILRNGRPVLTVNDSDLKLTNGFVRLIDHDADGAYDVIFIEDYVNVQVERVKEDTVYFTKELNLNGKRSLILDPKDKNVIFTIEDAEGNPLELDELGENDIVSVFAAEGGVLYRLRLGKGEISGSVESISGDEVTIGAAVYKMADGLNIKLGDDVTGYLDYRGSLAAVEAMKSEHNQFGYVVDASNEGLDSWKVKLLAPGDFVEEMVSNNDEDNPTETAVLRGRNKAVKVLELAPKVRVNRSQRLEGADVVKYFGDKHNGTLVNNRVVKYTLNSEGQISAIETPERIYDPERGIDKEKTYNSYEKTFGKSNNTPFGANEATKVLCVPDQKGVGSDDDYLASIEINNGSTYVVSGFDIDKESQVADLIVITTTLDASAGGVINNNSSYGVVVSNARTVDPDTGDETNEITMWTKEDGQVTRRLAELDEVRTIGESLRFGDVIYYDEDVDKSLNRITLVEALNPVPDYYAKGVASDVKTLFGMVDTIDFGVIDDTLNRRVDLVKVKTSSSGAALSEVPLNVRNPLALYLVDTRTGRVSQMEAEDIRQGSDMMFAHISSNKLLCAVVVR